MEIMRDMHIPTAEMEMLQTAKQMLRASVRGDAEDELYGYRYIRQL